MLSFIKFKGWRLAFIVLGLLWLTISSIYFYVMPYFSTVPKNDNLPFYESGSTQFEVKGKEIKFARIPNETPSEHKRSAGDATIVEAWLKSVGYSTDSTDYNTYSNSTLEDMANNGDIVALHMLEVRKIAEGDVSGAKKYAEKGVAYGSLNSIKSMAIYSQPVLSMPRVTPEEAKPLLMESLAYYSLLGIRGDTNDALLNKNNLIERFYKAYNVTNILSSDDEKMIDTRANDLYEKYQAQRGKLGLGDFDNAIPKAVRDFFNKK